MASDIFLVRHAETNSRNGLLYPEASEVPLSLLGRLHARSLRKYLARHSKDVTKLVVSPYPRAIETATHAFPNVSFITDRRLVEYAAIKTVAGAEYKAWKKETIADFNLVPPSGESMHMAACRVRDALLSHSTDTMRQMVVIGHALSLGAFLKEEFDLKDFPHLAEASITHLKYDASQFVLLQMNKTTVSIPYLFLKALKKIGIS
jgi:broad specificity phosphatase PhoE